MKTNNSANSLKLFENFSFWKKFSRLLLVGSSALVLLFVAQIQAISGIQEVKAQSTISLCGQTGVQDPGYPDISSSFTCTDPNQYLYVNVAGGYLSAACLAVPSGFVKSADGCSAVAASVTPPPPAAPAGQAHLAGGDIVQAYNNSTQQGTWRDPVDATPGQIIEFRVIARNDGTAPAEDVQVWGTINAQLPQGPSNSIVLTSRVKTASFMGNEVTDTATINLPAGASEGLRYVPGHARINGVTSVYNCPNTCDIGDNVITGINVGTIQPGDFVEVTFKAGITNTTSAPACVPNGGCSVQTPSVCGQTNTGVDNCGNSCVRASVACVAAQGAAPTQTQTQSQSVNVTNNNTNTNTVNTVQERTGNVGVGSSVAAPKTLPNTGLPIIAWSALGLVPAGFKLRKFANFKKALEDHPSFISAMRQFNSKS